MIEFVKRLYARVTGRADILLAIQGVAGVVGLGFWTWDAVTFVKDHTLGKIDFKLYPWTYYYFHPVESNLFNYIFLCVSLGLVAFFIYFLINKKTSAILHDWIRHSNPSVVFICTLASLLLIYSSGISGSFSKRSIVLLLLLCLPLLSVTWYSSRPVRMSRKIVDKGLFALSVLFFVLVILEPLGTIMGPVYLINDYPSIYGKTMINGSYLDNREFLQGLEKSHMDTVKRYLAVYDEIDIALRSARNIQKMSRESFELKIHEDELALFQQFRNRDLNPSQKYFTALISDPFSEQEWNARFRSLSSTNKGADEDPEDYIDNIRRSNMETLKQFYLANYPEYWLQNMGRGQIHHIGHYLNPLNEYTLGKPLSSIFLQYGLGSTLLSKWVMDLFGGLSIQNFYKTYVYYIIYFLLFVCMGLVIFEDRLYACAAISILPASFFSLGYVAYVLAPGFIPTVHLLDAAAFVVLLGYLKSGKWVYLGMLGLLALLSNYLNRQFGMALTISIFLSLAMYVLENKKGRRKCLWLLSISAAFLAAMASYRLFSIGALDEIFPYFWLGWLSWPVSSYTVAVTIFYLVVSYLFVFFLKNERFFLKYIYVAIFLYAQILLVYYYWSGVRNHLPTVMPFIWVQFILMLWIAEESLFRGQPILHHSARVAARGALCAAILFMIPTAKFYYAQKSFFNSTFENHKVYHWTFERANLISTLDPALMQESMDLVNKYSGGDPPSIYIISKYDGVIPFLAKKYSAMGFFELSSYIFSEKESTGAIGRIQAAKPEYLYVDSDIQDTAFDPWSKVYRSDYIDGERASRMNRYLSLQHVFTAVAGDYEKIEEGTLLSVYKRKAPGPA